MGFRVILCSILLNLLTTGILLAQPNRNGIPLITNYEHSITNGSEQNWCITQDSRDILYVGNNNKGILEYDGVEWRRIPVPKDPIIRSMVTGEDGVVYVGAVSEFGYLAPDRSGSMVYCSLSDSIDQEKLPFADVWRTYYHRGKVYFCTLGIIFIYDHDRDLLTYERTTDHSFFSFLIDSTLYVSNYADGLMRFDNHRMEPVPGGVFFREKSITGMVRYDESKLLIGTYNDGLYLFDTQKGSVDETFINRELNDYFIMGNITYLRVLNNDFVVSSLSTGVVILNRNGEATEIITEKEDLIDENVPFVYYNDQMEAGSPVWIANYMGVSKLEPTNPFRVFTESSGFEDFITGIKVFNGTLFISTFSGLYYRKSSSTGTGFVAVPETEGETIWHLGLFKPASNREFLIATTEERTFIIDPYHHVSILKDLVQNKPANLAEQAEYSGHFMVQDPDHPEIFYTGRSQIVSLEYHRGTWTETMRITDLNDDMLLNKVIDKYGYLWTSSYKRVIRIDIKDRNAPSKKFLVRENGLPFDEDNRVFLDPETKEVLLGTVNGFYRYNYFQDTIYRDTIHNRILPAGKNLIMAFYQDQDGDFWYSFENEHLGWTVLAAGPTEKGLEVIQDKSFQRLPNTSVDVIYSDQEGEVWFGNSNKLYHFNKKFSRNDTQPFRTLIRRVTIDTDSVIYKGTHFIEDQQGQVRFSPVQAVNTRPVIKYSFNNIGFRWAAPYFEQEELLTFSYKLEGFGASWSEWEKTPFKEFTNLPFGDYTLLVKARNIYGDESIPASYSFTVLRPWYAHFLAYLIYIILATLIVYVIIKLYTRRLKQENARLEGIIEERTAEIRKQKEELTDSIEYASRIQRALLPSEKQIDENDIEHFILFKPRDIVSGDFYWIGSRKERLIIVAADCTGHGVPGAFMSMLGMTFLDEIVNKSEVTNTAEILEQLREHVIASLKQSGSRFEDSTKDGMDLSMISIDMKKREFQYSGAYNPLYLVRELKLSEKTRLNKGEELDVPRGSIHNDRLLLMQIRADQMPIGRSEKTIPFTSSTFKDEGYSIYMFSDGFLDQFGGPQKKKFMSKNFKKLILEIQSVPLKDQGVAMEKVLTGWMGEISQIDDILVMGLKLKNR